MHDAGSEVWVTVTTAAEAAMAAVVGADALVVQGGEAGGHRGGFTDTDDAVALLPLLQLVTAVTDLPLVAAGGIATGAAVASVLAAGARAAAVGTAFLRCPEAGTSAVQRTALQTAEPTALTRAFTGRTARGIRNRFLTAHAADAPSAYPEVHYLTAPMRQAARAAGDPSLVNLWAGQAYPLGEEVPAAELVRRLHDDARKALRAAAERVR
jgi:nitronate monooxygenase